MYWKGRGVAKIMSALDTLNMRLQYRGGNTEARMSKDKLRTLKRVLFNSYQAETAILKDGKEFKCLINSDKETAEYDTKMFSIPFEDICLNEKPPVPQKTTAGIQKIDIKPGDVFTWKETDTHWLVFLQFLEETAYFRAQIRRCDQEIEVNGQRYWVYIRGPVETSIVWNQKAGVEWNDLNYSLVMYITQDENTLDFFTRFAKVKITKPGTDKKQTWQVVDADAYYGDGIIQVFLDEFYENTIEEEAKAEIPPEIPVEPDKEKPYIEGPERFKVYDQVEFTAHNFTENCKWYVLEKDKIYTMDETSNVLPLTIMKPGMLIIRYKGQQEQYDLKVIVEQI